MSSIAQLCSSVSQRFGLRARANWHVDVARAAEAIAVRRGTTVAGLSALLERNADLAHDVVDSMTVGETHFFRHPDHFDAVVDHIAPRLEDSSYACVWSAGCASGEEPYSVAMAIDARLGHAALHRVHIVGTDISPTALAKARAAAYSPWSFRGVTAAVRLKYFTRASDNCLSLTDAHVLSSVAFVMSGIGEQAGRFLPGSVDVVLFRNVAIYLEAPALAELFALFARVLRPGGLLIISPSDPRPPASLFTPSRSREHGLTIFESGAAADDTTRAGSVAEARATSTPHAAHVAAYASAISSTSGAGLTLPRVASHRPAGAAPVALVPAFAEPEAPAPVNLEVLATRDPARALELADAIVATQPDRARPCMDRGRLYLERQQHELAVADLRRAVFLEPQNVLARFWYAQALSVSGALDKARRQWSMLEVALSALDGDTRLDGDECTVSELLAAVRFASEESS